MFFQQKYKNTFLLCFSLLLIAYFIGIRAFFLMHQFSHHNSYNSIVQQKNLETKTFADKKISKNFRQKSEDEDDCLICYLAHLYQSNIILADVFALFIMSFVLVNNFSITKKFLILSSLFSYQTRAPPLGF